MAQAALRKNRAAPGKAKLGPLPVWRLDDLYPSRDAPEMKRDLDWAAVEAKAFRADFAGKVASLEGAALAGAIQRYEKLDETLSRIMSFASLTYSGNVSDPAVGRFFQSTQEKVNEISSELIFFNLEITKLDQAKLDEAKRGAPALARYAPWLRDIREYRDHVLPDDMERLLHDKAVAGRGARTVARHGQQVLAGVGFTTDHAFHRHLRRVLVLDQLLGSARLLTRELGEELLRTRRLPVLLPL